MRIFNPFKFKYIAVSLFLLIFVSCKSTGLRTEGEFTEKNDKKSVEIKVGKLFSVKLDSQPGTGYLWVVSQVSKNLEIVGTPQLLSSDDGKTGGIEKQVFNFKAKSAGNALIELHYKRYWEKKKNPAKIYKLKIRVKEVANIK